MPTFQYRAKDQAGRIREGVVDAISALVASETLHREKLTVLELAAESKAPEWERYLPFLGRISKKEMVLFSRQFATLINASIPIVRGLEILRDQTTSKRLKAVIEEMIGEVEGGRSLSETIASFPKVFSNLYVNLVKAGELSGTLDQALTYLADQQEKEYDLNSKIKGAMTYPIFIVSTIIVVGALMFVLVLPQLISVLKESGAELPLTTQILISVTEGLQKYWGLILVLLLGLIFGSQIYMRTPGGRIIWDTLKLRIPIFGKLLKQIYMDRLALNLSSLVAGGIPIVQSLQTVAEIVGNSVYKEIILDAAGEVETGKTIADSFAARHEIPRIVTEMVRVGEQTGSLDDLMSKLGRFYDKEVEKTLLTLTTLLEPVIMILLGVVVAIMVAGILLPMYNLAGVQ